VLAFALRRRPLYFAIPGVFAANVAFSGLGAGAATRAGTVVVFAAFAYLGSLLLRDEFPLPRPSKVAIPTRRRSGRCA
jgi:hypothetical protein